MTQWFRRGSEDGPQRPNGSAGRAEPPPTPPGGTGGSGFFAVGGTPPGPEAVPTAAEYRDRAAGRARRDDGSRDHRTGGGRPNGGAPRSGGSSDPASPGRRGLPRLGGSANGGPTPEERRFAAVYAEDRVGPMPYPHQAVPDVAAARGEVRRLVDDLLPHGVDEGTGAALDPLIASWASGWLARIDSEHADHHAVVDRLVGGARRQLAEAEAGHERDRRALEIARADYGDARASLRDDEGARGDGDAPTGSRGPLGRLGDRLAGRGPRRAAARDGASPTGSRERPPERSPERPTDRVGPADPVTRPVPVVPSTYGATFTPSPPDAE